MSTLNDLLAQLGDGGTLNDRLMQFLEGGPSSGPVKSNTLTRNMFRSQTVQALSADHTSHGVMELESHFLGFRLLLSNWHSEAIPNVRVSVALLEDAYNVNEAWLVELNPTTDWFDLPTINLPAGSLTFTDWLNMESLPRTDGGTRPLIMYRIEIPEESGAINVPTIGYAGWRTGESGRYFRTSHQDVLGVTTPASYTQNLSDEFGAIVPGVQYFSKNAGLQIMGCGDSTIEGSGTFPRGFAAPMKCTYEYLSTPENPVEYFNMGAAGQQCQDYVFHLPTITDDFYASLVIYSPYSINNMSEGGGGFTDDQWANVWGAYQHAMSSVRVRSGQTKVIIVEGLPVNTAGKNIGAGDADRLEVNGILDAMTGPTIALGYAEAISGAVVSGQTQIADGFTDDNIHPNAAGCQVLSDILLPLMEENL